jgi:MFS family permease
VSAKQEWRNGWTVVAAALIGMGMVSAPAYFFGAFVAPLHAAFGWNRAQLAIGPSIVGIISASTAALVGYASDRIGVRKIALCGAIVYCLAVAGLSQVGSSILSFWALYGLLAFGATLCSPLVWTRAVISRFKESRGLAISIVLLGSTIVGVIAPPAATLLIAHLGWRTAYVGLAIALFAIAFPALWLSFYEAWELEKRDKPLVRRAPAETAAQAQDGLTPSQVFRSYTFWLLAISAFLSAGVIVGVPVHLIPLLQDRGLDAMHAAVGLSVSSFASAVGRLVCGYLVDRVAAPLIAAIAFSISIIASLILLEMPAETGLSLVTVGMFGIGLSAELTLLPYVTARCFGLRSYGTIYGSLQAAFAIGGAVLPPLLGQLYERNHNYDGVLVAFAVMLFVSGAMFLLLRLPRHTEDPPAIPAAESSR